nr:hypothetical protein CFP56_68126 [Quercus suber]
MADSRWSCWKADVLPEATHRKRPAQRAPPGSQELRAAAAVAAAGRKAGRPLYYDIAKELMSPTTSRAAFHHITSHCTARAKCERTVCLSLPTAVPAAECMKGDWRPDWQR